jgi:hypothetical protein
MDVEAVACHIKKRFPELPIILLSAYCEMPARIPWLADDYIVKGETPGTAGADPRTSAEGRAAFSRSAAERAGRSVMRLLVVQACGNSCDAELGFNA